MHSGLLYTIGLSIVAASLLAYVARLLRQPLILGYIAAGILIGPQGLKLIENWDEIATLSELGLAFLLFIVGLEIDVKKFARSGAASGVIGTVQVLACAGLGLLAARGLGYAGMDALYIAVAISFSSTMIVVKLLSDSNELDTLPGRISLGVLLVQDVLAIFVLAVQSNLGDLALGSLAISFAAGIGLIAVSFLVSRYALPRAFAQVARSPELMLVLSITWCFVMCWLALIANFSIAMGSLIAGVSISTFPYSHDVIVKIRSLRDFFVTLFFVSLGMQVIVSSPTLVLQGLLLSAFVLVSRFMTIFPLSYSVKLGSRVGILTSVFLAQSSEFSLVIATFGLGHQHISREIVSLIAITLIVTSTISTYLTGGAHVIAQRVVHLLEKAGLRSSHHQDETVAASAGEKIVVLGCHRLGSALVHDLAERGERLHVFDFNPQVLTRLKQRGISASYADLSQLDTLERSGIDHASVIICAVSDDYLRGTTNATILRYLKGRGVPATIIVQSNSVREAVALYEAGADYVLVPPAISAKQIISVIERDRIGELKELRPAEVEALRARMEVLQ